MSLQISGVCKWYDPAKGFGFFKVEGERDVFVHVTAVKEAGLADLPKEGDPFNFDTAKGPKGIYAINLKRA